jgi:CRP-like cAMP-binding protein
MGQLEDQVKRLSVLLELPDRLHDQAAAALLRVSTFQNIDPGDVLFAEGAKKPNDGYVLLQGDVQIQRSDGFTTTATAPALIGEMQQFQLENEGRRSASVIAGQNTSVLHFDWPAFYNALENVISAEEMELVRHAFRCQAWMHYLEIDGEI